MSKKKKIMRTILFIIIIIILLCCMKCLCYTYENARDYFNNTLLVVLYNFDPPIKTIINHYHIWKNIFPNQLIAGHYDDIKQNIIEGELRKHLSNHTSNLHIVSAKAYDLEPGFLNYKILYYAISQLKKYDGYLFLHDDMGVNVTKILNLDRSKIWQETWTGSFGTTPKVISFTNVTWSNRGQGIDWPWFDTKWGIPALDKVMQNHEDVKSMLKKCSINNTESFDLQVCESDLVYFPSSVAEELKKYTKIFADHEVFLEIAIPTIITCFLPDVGKILLPLCTSWVNRHNYQMYEEECKSEYVFHPLKFSVQGGMELMQKLAKLES